MDFPENAASYAVFEARTGSNIGSAPDRSELFALLDEIHSHDIQALRLVFVVALDDKGQRIASSPAEKLFADA